MLPSIECISSLEMSMTSVWWVSRRLVSHECQTPSENRMLLNTPLPAVRLVNDEVIYGFLSLNSAAIAEVEVVKAEAPTGVEESAYEAANQGS